MDTPLFLGALFIHLTSLVVGFGAVLTVDTIGLLWIFKRVELSFVSRVAGIAQRLIWAGWCGLVLSGLVLITLKGYVDSLTKIKLFFVVLLALNGIFLEYIKRLFEELKDAKHIPARYLFRIGLASGISQLGWWGAMSIGFIHRHWKHNIPWPENPWAWMAAILTLIIAVAITGEVIAHRHDAR